MIMASLFLFLKTLLFFALIAHFSTVFLRKRNYPPGPMKLPIIGNLHELNDLPHRSLEKLSKRFGPIMLLRLGSIQTLVISSADVAREIFKTHDVIFSGRPILYAAKRISYNCSSVSFAPYGDRWSFLRKIMISELLSSKRVQSFRTIREEEVQNLVQTIACSGSSVHVNLSSLALSLVNDLVCMVAFGRKYISEEREKLREMLRETQDLLGGFCAADFFPWLGWINKLTGLEARLEKCFGELDRFYDEVIEEHKDRKRPNHEIESEDVVDVLLRVQKEDRIQGLQLDNDQIKGVLTDIFIAGSDTSAATIVWVMAELMKNPSTMRKAQEEVRQVSRGKGKIFESDLSELNYLKMVIKEGLRLHPPVPLLVPRETTEGCVIQGYEIPPKTRVFVNAKAIGRDPKTWKNPDKFWPERFLETSVDYRGQHYEFLPFGVGRRGCPGIAFGWSIVELALANLLCRFDWELTDGMKEEDLDMEEALGITTHKKSPLCLVAKVVN